jgi:hypothetical protein
MTALQRTPVLNPAAILRFAPALYASTIFLSALLLFLVQPMFTKMVLPRLGGAPTVWSVAMVFFQAALLAGYAYAHLLVRRLTPGVGALVHLGMLAIAALALPIGIAAGWGAPPDRGIALWVIGLFAVSIGLPFAILSASAPLLQGWFAATGHPQARNPYILYAASNLGSFTALLAYPVGIEPLLTLKQQSAAWSMGFALMAIMVAIASLSVAHARGLNVEATASGRVRLQTRLIWAGLAAVPAGLVIAVTSYITTDIAAAPFLWVLPLALYLLTFVAVFRDRPWLESGTVALLVPFAVAPLSISLMGALPKFWYVVALVNISAFLLLALLCHGELYRRRPASAQLTDFYLWVSLGGVVGGAFAALAAPHLFNRVYEYPILIACALLALPGMFARGRRGFLAETAPVLALIAVAVTIQTRFDVRLPADALLPFHVVLIGLVGLMLLWRARPARFLALAGLGMVLSGLWQPGLNRIESVRSFFGVHQVVETTDGAYRLLFHGSTLHGAVRIGADGTAIPEPLSYYYAGGPWSEAITATRAVHGKLGRVAVVGLGAGTVACHKRDDERWTFYEIDQDVVRIARDPHLFGFVSACAPDLPVVIGDARLTLGASAQSYDLIMVDAFSSDAIPVHLLTSEALAVYLARLNEGGAILMHISNRHMELASVVAAMAAKTGLFGAIKEDKRPAAEPFDFKNNAIIAVMARKPSDLGDLLQRPGWQPLGSEPAIAAWTDDYSDIFGAIMRKKFGS